MRIGLIILLLFLGNHAYSQNVGFYGHKNTIEVNTALSYPMFARLWASYGYYERSGTRLVEAKDRFDHGFRFSYSNSIKNNFGMGFEYSMEFSNMAGPSYAKGRAFDPWTGDNVEYDLAIDHENLRLRSQLFMPKFIFAKSGDLLPIGLSHQFGVGYSVTSIKDMKYLYKFNSDTTGYDLSGTQAELDRRLSRKFKGVTAMYEMRISTPLSTSMLLNIGIRYNFNYTLKSGVNVDSYDEDSQLYSELRTRRMTSIMNLNLGLSYAF